MQGVWRYALSDWVFAQRDAAQQLCQLHQFGIKSQQASGEVEFIITVREYVTPPDPTMKFFAQADKQTNQSVATLRPPPVGERQWWKRSTSASAPSATSLPGLSSRQCVIE